VDTPLGRKRAIDQSSCNQDLSCVDGFCPSFVTVSQARLRQPKPLRLVFAGALGEPPCRDTRGTYDILLTGIGGTGVVTIGALLGMAAHLEGKTCAILDQLGMAQKGGAVVSHIRIGLGAEPIHSVRVPTGGADLVLALDAAVSLQDLAFSKIAPGHTQVLLNTHESITGAFMRDPDMQQPTPDMVAAITDRAGADHTEAFDITELATALRGDSIAMNLFALGYAFQKGLVPLSAGSIQQAIRLNAVAVDFNLETLEWGRRAADNLQSIRAVAGLATEPPTESLESLIADRARLLTDYQDERYARSYIEFMEPVRTAERSLAPGQQDLSRAVARSLYRLMAYKDEYEVARLYTDGHFQKALEQAFEGPARLRFHLAPPILGQRDPRTGHLRKQSFGPWVLPLFAGLARLKGLRGTRLDLFGYTSERRMERRLIADYRETVRQLLEHLTEYNRSLAVEIAELPLSMRGYGHVKEANVRTALEKQGRLLRQFTASGRQRTSPQPELESN
jgi:indolepyruvate ferredoxin oxidoreductase